MDSHLTRKIDVIVLESTDITLHVRDIVSRSDQFFKWLLISIDSIQESRAPFLDICLENLKLFCHYGNDLNFKLVSHEP